ncbi:MAG: hydrogenase maturation nickel metallochaperone HypA [Candidatus Omnitrophica bacterium]|nr:hydrogenase maturation nickel metallochaperone HypA [Candidatus Omnitrophota bacterium]
MHEMSIAQGMIEQIEKIAQDYDAIRVTKVEIETGILRQVIADVMQTAFQAVSEGTLAEGSLLELREVPALAECRKCKMSFEPEIDNFLCPQCHLADVKILQGDEIILKSMECDSKEKKETHEN